MKRAVNCVFEKGHVEGFDCFVFLIKFLVKFKRVVLLLDVHTFIMHVCHYFFEEVCFIL